LKRLFPFFIFAVVLLFFSTSPVFAQAQVRVRIIEASNAGSVVDTSLGDVHRDLAALFSFTSYRLLKDVNLNLVGNRPIEVLVHPGRSMEVTLIGGYRRLTELRIRIKREGVPILSTNVKLAAGRAILIGGPRHGEGTIIFAVSARF
jgi:hypothetical protein